MKKFFSGKIIFLSKLSKTILASSDNNKGRESPIGEAVAILPAIVATFLIWTDPYRLRIVLKSE